LSLLVLFDIDGTLVLTGGAGVRAMDRAFALLHGRERALEGVPIAGRTDRAIVTTAMQGLGIEPTTEAIERLRDVYLDCLRVEIGRPPAEHPSVVLPGIAALLDALSESRRTTTALLTGNFARGAEIKLEHFALWQRFQFGAFGDAHIDRRALVPIALQRARAAGLAAPDEVVIIGDTPHDIDCAKACGALGERAASGGPLRVRALGVATGSFDRASLHAAGADLAVDTLEPVDRVMRWLTND
jgi:phosphoglycolate phosphatase-like HAD superfamily hydrolase